MMVNDIIKNTKANIKKGKIKSISDIYNCKEPLVEFSVKIKLFDVEIKTFLKKKMYFSKEVFAKTNLGKKIIKFLFDKVKKKPNKFFKKNTNNSESLERQVSDFIAGMTDRYAINLYDSLK